MNDNQAEFERLGKEIESIDLLISETSKNRTIDEQTFKVIFLPMFYGAPKEELHRLAKIGGWISCAGSAYAEVDVISHTGEYLFSVPPAKLQMPLRRSDDVVSLSNKCKKASLYTSYHPQRGNKYLKEILNEYGKEDVEFEKVREYVRRWGEIFKRYGYTVTENDPVSNKDSGKVNSAYYGTDEVEEVLG